MAKDDKQGKAPAKAPAADKPARATKRAAAATAAAAASEVAAPAVAAAEATQQAAAPKAAAGAAGAGRGRGTTGRSRRAADTGPVAAPVSDEELNRLAGGAHHDPHSILGAHPYGDVVTIRTMRPGATAVTVVTDLGGRHEMTHEAYGIWVALLPGATVPDYRLDVTYGQGAQANTFPVDDAYRYLPTLGELDLHLIGEGRHEQLWDVLGAHVREYRTLMGTTTGTSFAVWAPNAQGVRVTGSFAAWQVGMYPMRSLGTSGVWELFIPGIGDGAQYKFHILGGDGVWREKADPMAFRTEVPPATASVVHTSGYRWADAEWLRRRAATDWLKAPFAAYEVHLGSWRPGLSYTELADQLVSYVQSTGFTHVELLPVAEHPFGASWGYQVTSYFAPTARFGDPDGFRHLVDKLHQAGIGVIIDWVPAHFPKDAWALARFDGTALYEHSDPRLGEHPDWGTYVFNFGRSEVRNFLVANALYWLEEFHVDGLRVDAVASMLYLDYSREPGQWVPNQFGGNENLDAVSFVQEVNATVYKRVPGAMMIAEESTAWPAVSRPTYLGGLGFGFKWNMGWMHDTLGYVSHEPVHRMYHHNEMTFSMMYAYTENFVLPLSHDEVVHGKGSLLSKMPGDYWQQRASLRALLAYMWSHPGKKLLFMGCEFGQGAEWSEGHGLDWWLLDTPEHDGIRRCMIDINRVYRENRALWSQDVEPLGFRWIDANDAANNCFTWLRWGDDGSVLACLTNFSGVPRLGYRVGLPTAGHWVEVLNTDAHEYGGSGVGNLGGRDAEDLPWHGLPASASVELPPLGAVWLRHTPTPTP